MTKFRNRYRVEGNRMRILNYSAPGYYFITNNIQGRHWILGHVSNQQMVYSEYGEIVKKGGLKNTGVSSSHYFGRVGGNAQSFSSVD